MRFHVSGWHLFESSHNNPSLASVLSERRSGDLYCFGERSELRCMRRRLRRDVPSGGGPSAPCSSAAHVSIARPNLGQPCVFVARGGQSHLHVEAPKLGTKKATLPKGCSSFSASCCFSERASEFGLVFSWESVIGCLH